jgi:hypothetical protein
MTPARAGAARAAPVKADVDDVSPREIVYYEISPSLLNQILLAQADTPEPLTDAPIDSEIYSPGADGVLPPVGVGPQLPRVLPPNVDLANLSRIELIIARDGTVESAKLLGNRRDVQGGMFLSAAKAWQFRPATKDGVAVRFRKMILVSFE